MTSPVKMKIYWQGEIADIRMLLSHPMETGQRKDDSGRIIPPHFIQTFSVSCNGRPLVEGQLNTSISRNPLFSFKARGIQSGDHLLVAWTDNQGNQRQDEITVA